MKVGHCQDHTTLIHLRDLKAPLFEWGFFLSAVLKNLVILFFVSCLKAVRLHYKYKSVRQSLLNF